MSRSRLKIQILLSFGLRMQNNTRWMREYRAQHGNRAVEAGHVGSGWWAESQWRSEAGCATEYWKFQEKSGHRNQGKEIFKEVFLLPEKWIRMYTDSNLCSMALSRLAVTGDLCKNHFRTVMGKTMHKNKLKNKRDRKKQCYVLKILLQVCPWVSWRSKIGACVYRVQGRAPQWISGS